MWQRIRSFFRDSEVLAWARFQTAIGAVAQIVTLIDPTLLAPVLPGEWFPWLLIINGVATEILRRLRATDL